jgi:hypothetical protein
MRKSLELAAIPCLESGRQSNGFSRSTRYSWVIIPNLRSRFLAILAGDCNPIAQIHWQRDRHRSYSECHLAVKTVLSSFPLVSILMWLPGKPRLKNKDAKTPRTEVIRYRYSIESYSIEYY